MKYFKIAVTLTLLSCMAPDVMARGFGGGGGGYRGGGGGYRGGMSDFGRGGNLGRDMDAGFGRDMSDGFGRGMDDGFGHDLNDDRPSAFSTPYGGMNRDGDGGADRDGFSGRGLDNSGGADRAFDTGVKDWNTDAARAASRPSAEANRLATQHPLSTDGGFSRLMRNADTQAGIPRNYTTRVSPAALVGRGDEVRRAFNRYDYFTGNWWRNHHGWWYPWWGDRWPWTWCTWGTLAPFWGLDTFDDPQYYDYGNNVSYNDDQVYYGSQPVATADDYYNQAQSLAEAGVSDEGIPAAQAQSSSGSTIGTQSDSGSKDSANWRSFGVFSLVQGSQTNSSAMFELAVNKSGKIRGNYYNVLTDTVKSLKGSVDKKSMRAAWTVDGSKSIVYDTGVANLLKDQSPILVHLSKSTTQQWTLVRVKQPDTGSATK